MVSKRRIKLLNAEVATAATRRSTGYSMAHRGMLLSVSVDNPVGSPQYTPRLQMQDPKNGWTKLWVAAAPLTSEGIFHYLFYPIGLAQEVSEEYHQLLLPDVWRFVLNYDGTPAADYADTAASAELIP